MAAQSNLHEKFGSKIPFAEPAWYQGKYSPYYTPSHVAFRAKVRAFVEKEIKPHMEDWLEAGERAHDQADYKGYPLALHRKAYEAGIAGIIYPRAHGGTPPEGFNAFHELILWDELARSGGGGVLGQLGINSMTLPPVLMAGTDAQKALVCRDVITGRKNISLAISEPGAGSDVANIQASAVLDPTGEFYIVNGAKKWITGGLFADFFTTAVRTGGPDSGMGGISLLLIERDRPGIKVRKMKTQFSTTHNTTFILFNDVKVPRANLIGQEGMGFFYIVNNFNHERFVISCSTARQARVCYEEAMKWAVTRRTFGKKLIGHQLIRFKLAEMVRQIESLQDMLERCAYQFANGMPDRKMGGPCALLKVQASKTFEYCAREASQIFGGSSVVREGRGAVVERLYREVRAAAIPGGSEEILLDFAMRQVAGKL